MCKEKVQDGTGKKKVVLIPNFGQIFPWFCIHLWKSMYVQDTGRRKNEF
jgi:hypothetical protein